MTEPRSRNDSSDIRRWRRVVSIVMLAVLLALAGCNGVFGTGDQRNAEGGTTVTPLDVPTDQAADRPAGELAPGLTADGITDGSELLQAQQAFFDEHSTVSHSNSTTIASNGSVLSILDERVRRGQSGDAIAYTTNITYPTRETSTGLARIDEWATNDRTYLRWTFQNGSVTYRQQPGRAGGSEKPLGWRAVSTYIIDAEQNGSSVVLRQVNGSPRYLVSGNFTEYGVDTNYRLTIDERGVTRKLLIVRPNPGGDGRERRARITFRSTGTTETLETPSWIDEAERRSQPPTSTIATVSQTTGLTQSEPTARAAVEASVNTTTRSTAASRGSPVA